MKGVKEYDNILFATQNCLSFLFGREGARWVGKGTGGCLLVRAHVRFPSDTPDTHSHPIRPSTNKPPATALPTCWICDGNLDSAWQYGSTATLLRPRNVLFQMLRGAKVAGGGV